ncbi:hypothetical protein BCF59_0169 [Mycoplasmopsis mustelae]|uniref:Uncharacterized protein n=1 Tax=Mycoplasmopsis mustelae TaxID=171289 RepID=A0A4R7UCQ7_9BACT|nr:hypothetical protein [Mycoplasmopsis mustelae]TDV24218.1 hypothetical protein BCF59_0169 [Mycoplasmopsis mustelae]
MKFYQKYKTEIFKNQFYILLVQVALLTAVLLVWVLIPFGYGINRDSLPSDIRNNPDKISEYAKKLSISTLISYLANTFVLVFFLIYLLLLRNKLKAGYIFWISWIVIYFVLAFLPFFRGVQYMSNFQIIVGAFISVISASIVISLFTFCVQYHIKRKFHYYEWIKIHKGRSR